MARSPITLEPATLAKLSGLELRARRIVDGALSGAQRSPQRGSSIEFAEHREYAPGDDLRHVDWKVYGKTDKYYLKQYEQETNLRCYLALDTSASMNYRGPAAAWSKWQCAQTIAAMLAYLVLRQRDTVGAALFSDAVGQTLEPAGSAGHWSAVIHTLEQQLPAGKTAFSPVMRRLVEDWPRRGLVIVLSDFLADLDEVVTGLRYLRFYRHDVLAIQVIDPAEREFPFRDTTVFHGLEGEPELTVDATRLRAAYAREFAAHERGLQAACRELGCDHWLVTTAAPLDAVLSRFLAQRMHSATRA